MQDPAQYVCIQFLIFSFHCWSFHNGCGLILLKLQIPMTAHLHTDIKILFIRLTGIVIYIDIVLLSCLFGTIISFPRKEA